jgi:hypothetical protein
MVKMAPTNLATAAAGVGVGEDTMVAMAAKAQVMTLAAKLDLLAAVIPATASPVVRWEDCQVIKHPVQNIGMLIEQQVDSQDLKAL